MDYHIFNPIVTAPLHTLSREEAKNHFELYVNSVELREKELLKEINGEFQLDGSVDSLMSLGMFLTKNIEEHPHIKEPSGKTFSLCNDISMYLGNLIIKESGSISWKLNTIGEKDISYHRPVLMGFNVKNKKYNVDLDLTLCQYAFRYIEFGEEENDLLIKLYEATIKYA